ncbi:MAG: hypothetical protein LBQ88_04215 [Treponema sp.]|jgi:hypothetical protein|nr:hypothetical protein [Treponema sp.]
MHRKLRSVIFKSLVLGSAISSGGLAQDLREDQEQAFTPAIREQAGIMREMLAEKFSSGARIVFISVSNEAADSVKFARAVLGPTLAVFQENRGLSFIDGDRARADLGIGPDHYIGQDEAKDYGAKINADVIITARVHEGLFVFDGWSFDGEGGDAAFHQETEFIFHVPGLKPPPLGG